MDLSKKKLIQKKRKFRVRKNINGTEKKPRLSLKFTNKHIYAQCIDDEKGKTLSFITSNCNIFKKDNIKNNIEGCKVIATFFSKKLESLSINKSVLDRGYKKFHGKVKAFYEVLKKEGFVF